MFLCNIALYSIRPCFYHQSHPQPGIVFALAPSLHSFWSYFSTDLQYHIGQTPTWGVSFLVSYHFAFSYCSWGSQGKNVEVVCHSLLQWTPFYQTFPPWPVRLGWPHTPLLSFIEWDKAVVLWADWLVFCEYGFSVSALWCPLATPTILLQFLFPWTWGISSQLLQQSTAAAPFLGRVVSPQGRPSWPWTWSSFSWPSCAHTATALWMWVCSSWNICQLFFNFNLKKKNTTWKWVYKHDVVCCCFFSFNWKYLDPSEIFRRNKIILKDIGRHSCSDGWNL